MAETNEVIWATGRRKTSVARVKMVPGSGKWSVNSSTSLKDYFDRVALINFVEQPLNLTNLSGKFDITASLTGGGIAGQAGALRHAVTRGLLQTDPTLRAALKAKGCITRDPRMKERKKAGQPGARKRFQFSKR